MVQGESCPQGDNTGIELTPIQRDETGQVVKHRRPDDVHSMPTRSAPQSSRSNASNERLSQRATLSDIKGSWALVVFRVFHAWIFFVASMIMIGLGLATFLDLFMRLTDDCIKSNRVLGMSDLLAIVHLGCKTVLLVFLWSGMGQCGVWLVSDSFAADMFLSYRRTLCLEGTGPHRWFSQTIRVPVDSDAHRRALLAAVCTNGDDAGRVLRDSRVGGLLLLKGWVLLRGQALEFHDLESEIHEALLPIELDFSTTSSEVRSASLTGADRRGTLRAHWDMVCQACIYLSLDAFPVVCAFAEIGNDVWIPTVLASRAVIVAMIHIATFFIVSTATDYYWKFTAFVDTPLSCFRSSTSRRSSAAAGVAPSHECSSESEMRSGTVHGFTPQNSCGRCTSPSDVLASDAGSLIMAESPTAPISGQPFSNLIAGHSAQSVDFVAASAHRAHVKARSDDLNFLVVCIRLLSRPENYLLLVLLGIVCSSVALQSRLGSAPFGSGLIATLLAVISFAFAIRSKYCPPHLHEPYSTENGWTQWFEDNCALDQTSAIVKSFFGMTLPPLFLIGLSNQHAVFSIAGVLCSLWYLFAIICSLCCWHHFWKLSLVQTCFFGSSSLLSSNFSEPGVHDGPWATILLMVVTQLGNWRMGRAKADMCLTAVLTIAGITIAVISIFAVMEDTRFSVFKNISPVAHCDNEQGCIEFDEGGFFDKPYGFCSLSWPMGGTADVSNKCRDKKLGITDFAMMASLPMLLGPDGNDHELIHGALQRNFPGWTLIESRVHDLKQGSTKTFVHLQDKDGHTNVIAVRGMSTVAEMLQDIVVWMPVMVIQFAEFLGPSWYLIESVQFLASRVSGDFAQTTYAQLDEYVAEYVATVKAKKDPVKIYLTGHSLGGGLATIVGSKQHIPAITFSAPGLGYTQTILGLSKYQTEGFVHRSVNVVPDRDLVPQLDIQVGTVLHMRCSAQSRGHCHLLSLTLCELLASCGAGAGHGINRGYHKLPCELCTVSNDLAKILKRKGQCL